MICGNQFCKWPSLPRTVLPSLNYSETRWIGLRGCVLCAWQIIYLCGINLEVIMRCPDCDEQTCEGCEVYEDFLDDVDDFY